LKESDVPVEKPIYRADKDLPFSYTTTMTGNVEERVQYLTTGSLAI